MDIKSLRKTVISELRSIGNVDCSLLAAGDEAIIVAYAEYLENGPFGGTGYGH